MKISGFLSRGIPRNYDIPLPCLVPIAGVRSRLQVLLTALFALVLTATSDPAWSMQPFDFVVSVRTSAAGPVDRVSAKVTIVSNAVEGAYVVKFRQRDIADNSVPRDLSPHGGSLLKPGGTAHGTLTLRLTREPKQVVVIDALLLDGAGAVVRKESAFLFFRVAGSRFALTTYADAYIPQTRSPGAAGDIDRMSVVKGRSGTVVRAADIIGFGSTVPRERITDLRPLLTRMESALPQGTSVMRKHLSIDQLVAGGTPVSYVASGDAQKYAVSGKFFFIGVDNSWHPAVNWTARLSWRTGGGDHILAFADVQADGSWATTFSAPGYTGQNLLVHYAPTNRFAKMVDKEDREFWWASTLRSNIPIVSAIGDEAADTSGAGWLMGMGDAFQSAMVFWNRFYLAGVDAARDKPIRMYFPNTWYMCGTKRLWSCSSQDDAQLWLISAHFDSFTVQHELAHQLNSQYWPGGIGGGGDHSTMDCKGGPAVALTEGFADTVPYWINGNVNATSQPGRWGDIESPIGCVGDWNEMHVASTLWDFMDTNADGLDHVASDPVYAPLLIYLMAGKKDSFRFYREDFRAAFPPSEAAAIDDVLRQNSIAIVP